MKKLFLGVLALSMSLGVSAQLVTLSGETTLPGSLIIGDAALDNQKLSINTKQAGQVAFNFSGKEQIIKSVFSTRSTSGGYMSFNILKSNTATSPTEVLTLSASAARFKTGIILGEWGLEKKIPFTFGPIDIDSYRDISFYRGIRYQDGNTLYLDLGDNSSILEPGAFVIKHTNDNLVEEKLFSVNSLGKVEINANTDVRGTLRAEEVIVESVANWADFVFDKNYNLPTLGDVKNHIDEHKHLPGIPSEKQIKEEGINLVEMQARMMQKIEELTLYAIQQNEVIEKLTKKVQELDKK